MRFQDVFERFMEWLIRDPEPGDSKTLFRVRLVLMVPFLVIWFAYQMLVEDGGLREWWTCFKSGTGLEVK